MQSTYFSWGHSDTGELGSYEPMNPYNMNITNTVNTLRGTVAEEIEKNTDWELFGQNVASFLYQTGMSIGDSTLQVGTLGRAATLFMGGSAVGGVISGGVMGGVTDGVNWAGNTQRSQTGRKVDAQREYASRDLSKDGSVYSYDFLTSLPDMMVTALPPLSDVKINDRVDQKRAVELGLENA